jgi:hypothetical protein
VEDFFDPEFLSELEVLVAARAELPEGAGAPQAPHEALVAFLAERPEAAFVELTGHALAEHTNRLIEVCRQGAEREAVEAVESFVVFFQTLAPTLAEDGAREIKRFFYRLIPTLVHVAHSGFSSDEEAASAGAEALHSLETILIEISSVRLAPSESELVFRAIDQMTAFISVGEYALASEVISSRLLSIIARNKLTRALYRLMEIEVSVQVYLKEKRGYLTPQIRLPEDEGPLADYGPIRVLREESPEGRNRRLIQIHLPHITTLRDIVLHLESAGGEDAYDLRLDALGSAELQVPDGAYNLGLIYQPETPSA